MKLFSVKHILSLALITGLCTPSTHGWLHLPGWPTMGAMFTISRSLPMFNALCMGYQDREHEVFKRQHGEKNKKCKVESKTKPATTYRRGQATVHNLGFGLVLRCIAEPTISGSGAVKECAAMLVLNYLAYCVGKYGPALSGTLFTHPTGLLSHAKYFWETEQEGSV